MFYFVIFILCNICRIINGLQLINGNLILDLDPMSDEIKLVLSKGHLEKLSGSIGYGKNLTKLACPTFSNCFLKTTNYNLTITTIKDGFNVTWTSNNDHIKFFDCFNLNKTSTNWFGGPELLHSEWPIENLKFINQPYIISKINSSAIAERYWLNSKGGYIFVGDQVPLFVDQNNLENDSICFMAKAREPFIGRKRVVLQYALVAKKNVKLAHLQAVETFLGKPLGRPNSRIIRHPIWSTWAKYKSGISDEVVVDFARSIFAQNLTGQLEIDDFWETCYGSTTFNSQFKNINETVATLHQLGFTVSLWTHPFVNDDCEEPTRIGRQYGYFIKSINGSDQTSWWNGNARHIDFTKQNASKWFMSKLKLLQNKHGIDSFKFDAGEVDWAPSGPILNANPELTPNILTSFYVETCARFGDLIEVRSGWRTQNLPVLVRMIDKSSKWGLDNGLHSLIVTLLQMNINGYTLVLPDMIGGNGYGEDVVTPELLVRWTQANTFMPVMQFSYLPWEITSHEFDVVAIVKKYIHLHEQYADRILKAIKASIDKGIPVNPPIWWADPQNADALTVNDEYMLGEDILVAPIVKQGAKSRDIVLPRGSWQDGNNGSLYHGPQTIKHYPAPIDVLPFFIKHQN